MVSHSIILESKTDTESLIPPFLNNSITPDRSDSLSRPIALKNLRKRTFKTIPKTMPTIRTRIAVIKYFITAILVLIVGIVFGMVLKVLFLRFFKAIGLDRLSERSGVIELLRKGGIRDSVSVLLSRIIGWLTIVVFAVISMKALEVSTVERIFERILLYLPNVFVATLF